MASYTGAEVGNMDIDSDSKSEFHQKRAAYQTGGGSFSAKDIRLTAETRPGESWGTGYDEGFATRKQIAEFTGMSASERADIFSQRFPTKHLVFPSGVTDGSYSPLAGHTPAVKHTARVAGTTNALTKTHYHRDKDREAAIDESVSDVKSRGYEDATVMARLATHKYMSAPKETLDTVKAATLTYSKPLYMTHASVGDLRTPTEFDKMTEIVQEQREKHKWETAALLASDTSVGGNSGLIPEGMASHLSAAGNDPDVAMNNYRTGLHAGVFGAFNTSTTSATDDLTTNSLEKMRLQAAAATTPASRPRALSDARWIPPVRPAEVV